MFSFNMHFLLVFSLKIKYGQILKFKMKAQNIDVGLCRDVVDQPESKARKRLKR